MTRRPTACRFPSRSGCRWRAASGAQPARRVYLSADSVKCDDDGVGAGGNNYPVEFLNGLTPSGVPPHELHLLEGCPIILLRNMNGGLANGTRLIVTRLQSNVIEAQVETGPSKGSTVFIPRISLFPSDARLPFQLVRRQFPVRPAFAMTINKAQGQTLTKVGVFLPKPVFSHGQLYVALGRCGDPGGVKVLVPDGRRDAADGAPAGVYTSNVVYQEVLSR